MASLHHRSIRAGDERRLPMSLYGRISELSAKHRHLDEKIASEEKSPSGDALVIKDLKRQKLRIKEQLQHLRAS
ncbi:DUF465 domain-containing protein [Hyphomonas sp. WL0036]|nr:DUF465 domain-containing protein [Hyphomonas sediminis]